MSQNCPVEKKLVRKERCRIERQGSIQRICSERDPEDDNDYDSLTMDESNSREHAVIKTEEPTPFL